MALGKVYWFSLYQRTNLVWVLSVLEAVGFVSKVNLKKQG